MKTVNILFAAMFIAGSASAQWNEKYYSYTPEFNQAGGVLAAPNNDYFGGVVPAGKIFVMNQRTWVDAQIGVNGAIALDDANVTINGEPGSSFYHSVTNVTNTGSGMVGGDYRRVNCVGLGSMCFGHKTALRNDGGPATWGHWLHSEQIGGKYGAMAVRFISGDNPQGHGVSSYPLMFGDVVFSDLDVYGAVYRWNVSPNSTGDFIQVLGADNQIKLQITKDGAIWIKGVCKLGCE